MMVANAILLTFDGYWREPGMGAITSESGVYVVYECSHYSRHQNTVTLLKVIYIGESEDVRKLITGEPGGKPDRKWSLWRSHCRPGYELCFSFAAVAEPERQVAAAAMILDHRPPANEEDIPSASVQHASVELSGRIALLHASGV